jgi:Fe-Mn family superoxide dismutase
MMTFSRREALARMGWGTVALAWTPFAARAAAPEGFPLPKLPYDYDALEPHIDKETMQIHHDLHHAAYVNNLNAALAGKDDLLKMDIVDLLKNLNKVPDDKRQAVLNNGGGHANHLMFWESMAQDGKGGGGEPKGELAKAINSSFESFSKFQEKFNDAGLKRFGSGWVWLVANKGKLEVISTANQDSPWMTPGLTPLLGNDVWEHAYYLKYRNKRGDYLKAWWNVVNWDRVAERYSRAKS